jgi:ABC-type transporter Mla subunit MlaD
MATIDDGIDNLRRFLANLSSADGALETITRHLGETARAFVQLEADSDERGGRLSERLEGLHAKLGTEEQEARQAVEDLGQVAQDEAKTLGEAQVQVEQAAAGFEGQTHAVSAELEQGHARLTDQGFTLLEHTLEDAEQRLEGARQELEQALGDLESTIPALQAEVRSAWDAVDGAFDQASSDLRTQEEALTMEASDSGQGFLSSATELESACSSLEEDIATIYDGFSSSVDVAGQELAQAIQDLVQQAIGFVEAGRQARLDEPADSLAGEALGPLREECRSLQASLDSAASATADLEPLADELAKCQAVIGDIDKLLNALAE